MRREQAQSDGRGKGRPCRCLRQALHPQRPAQPDALAEDPCCQTVQTGDLAGTACQHDLLAGQVVKTRPVQPHAHLFQNFLDARAHDADQLGPAHRAPILVPIAGIAAHFDHLAVIHACRLDAAVPGLDPFGHRDRHLQPLGDIRRHMIPTHAHRIGIDHVLLDEDRQAR